ncbi:hypothetical protein PCANC_17110 [Puccinia coronata f. sp. avenae]|uniref:Uncharacterized protein n=1 Tax=Puccinia coronata f. sp. avenae TaxID=200324 RepID=A0A2N5U596_9BASI|nr:hypothetical protein PCANC_17110 [Puccinia coronata f. sp. avenae]
MAAWNTHHSRRSSTNFWSGVFCRARGELFSSVFVPGIAMADGLIPTSSVAAPRSAARAPWPWPRLILISHCSPSPSQFFFFPLICSLPPPDRVSIATSRTGPSYPHPLLLPLSP